MDNAVIESWHSTVEFELRRLEHFASKAEARTKVAAWIEEYNHDRRHSALGYLGTQLPTAAFTLISQVCTLAYFGFFLLMPWWSTMGTFKPVPTRVTFTPH